MEDGRFPIDKFLAKVLMFDDTQFYGWAGVFGFTRAPLETISLFRQRVVHCMFVKQQGWESL